MALCAKCQRRQAWRDSLVCLACRQAHDAKPRTRTYERPPTQPANDCWRKAQESLYPNRIYTSLTKAERVRVQRLARAMAQIPYDEQPPALDDESLHHLALHLAPTTEVP